MDSVLYAEFLLWKEKPSLDHSSAFLSRIYREDVGPCLSFTRSEVTVPHRREAAAGFSSSLFTDIHFPAALAAGAERRGEQLADYRARGHLGAPRGQSLGDGVRRAQVSIAFTHRFIVFILSQQRLSKKTCPLLNDPGWGGLTVPDGCSLWAHF